MERMHSSEINGTYTGGGIKNQPHCDHCGRPVKLNQDDYLREETLCVQCAAEARAWDLEDQEAAQG